MPKNTKILQKTAGVKLWMVPKNLGFVRPTNQDSAQTRGITNMQVSFIGIFAHSVLHKVGF